jgi:hypothetical protein
MQPRNLIIALASSTLLSACSSDNPAGPFEKSSITVNLCPEFVGSGAWIGVQNQGEGWTEVTPNGSGTLTFDATDKVSLAFVYSSFGSNFTQVVNASAAALDGTTGVSCENAADFGSASLSGTISGMSGEEFVRLSAGASGTEADVTLPTWTLSELPNLSLDLVATRYASVFTSPANKIIVRRGVTPNSSGLTLDFAAAEARDFENAIVAFTNVPTNGTVHLEMNFQTETGTYHPLGTLSDFQAPYAFNYVTVPASLRVATDIHFLDVFASSASAQLGIVHVYKAPAAKTLSFGPPLGTPTITQVATSPYLRLRAQLTKQPEYPSGTSVLFGQNTGEGVNLVHITTTEDFLGAASTWDVTIPGFDSASGYDPEWGISAAAEYFWSVMAFEADASLLLGGPPADGATATYSIRGSGESQSAAARVSSPRVTPRTWRGMQRGVVR